MFQSLFCWITHFGPCLAGRAKRRRRCFNPCSAGSPTSAHTYFAVDMASLTGFQSLFCWITHFGIPANTRGGRRRNRFNPCSAGSPTSALVNAIVFQCGARSFNPCSAGSPTSALGAVRARSRTHCFNPCSAGSPTSAQTTTLTLRGRRWGFNPCSAGSPTSACRRRSLQRRCPAVSILVLLDHPLRPRCRSANRTTRHRVSILVLLDHPLRPPPCRSRPICRRRVSILVLLDHPLRPPPGALRRASWLAFQSLFCWITHFGHLRHPGKLAACRGFNPCSAGSPTSASRWPLVRALHWNSFNPCSAGSPSSARPMRRSTIHCCSVSILVLLDHPLRPSLPKTKAQIELEFQSLFCWITHFGQEQDSCRVAEKGVSILVLLDHPLRPRFGRPERQLRNQGFQSLFCWITLFGLVGRVSGIH